jgi:putative oxidoreductase
MSQAQYTSEQATPPQAGGLLRPTSIFLSRWGGPLGVLARAMLAYIFIVEGSGKIAGYAGVADYMQAHGVDGRLLPLVILTELGGGPLVVLGLKTRWAAVALFGFCLLTALFFHLGTDQTIQMQKNIAMAGAFSLWLFSAPAHGRWTLGAPAPSNEGSCGRR